MLIVNSGGMQLCISLRKIQRTTKDVEREISELKRVTAVQQPRDSRRYAVLDEDTRSS